MRLTAPGTLGLFVLRYSSLLVIGTLALMLVYRSPAGPTATVGQEAPGFTLKDSDGRAHSLADFKGKFVVLEWVNYDCPVVGKHYRSGNMQALQKTYTGKGVVWLSVCSSAPGKEGHFDGEELRSRIQGMKAAPTAYLVDADGTVGQLYAAKTTPHMYVIDAGGRLIYAGGIDDTPSASIADIAAARNYVKEALELAMAGKPVAVSASRSYGCSVKY